MTIDQAIGREIRHRLIDADMSQADLARRLNVTTASVSRKLPGQRHITAEDLYDYAQALEVEPADLLPRRSAIDTEG